MLLSYQGIAVTIEVSANVIDSNLENVSNKDIVLNRYLESAKISNVRPIFKKDEKTKVKNYQSARLLNISSKIYEGFVH